MTYQLVPSHNHHRNIATEKAIQTFKDHFMAVLCGITEKFLMHLWCHILQQVEHQLNLLWKSNVTPAVSCFAAMYRQHDYNVNPVAPLGCKADMHVMLAQQRTFEEHTTTGYYLGNS